MRTLKETSKGNFVKKSSRICYNSNTYDDFGLSLAIVSGLRKILANKEKLHETQQDFIWHPIYFWLQCNACSRYWPTHFCHLSLLETFGDWGIEPMNFQFVKLR